MCIRDRLSAAIGTRVGKQKAEVNSRGKVTRILESTEPQSGNDVMLTIDYELQQKLESALDVYKRQAEGVTYAILFMNVVTPLIDRFVHPKLYGEAKKHA